MISASRDASRPLPPARHARIRDRRRGGAVSRDVLARGTPDPQGAPIGVARDEGGVHACASSPPTTPTTRCARRSTRCRSSGAANQPERGFSMAIDDLYVPGTVFALAEDEDGAVGGFLHLAPTPAGGGWSLSTMRRSPESPNGLTEFLIVKTRRLGEGAGRRRALAQLLRADRLHLPASGRARFRARILRRGLLAADSVFQLERLYAFNRKFFPEWRPALPVRRAAERPAARRSRIPPRRAAAHAARPMGEARPQTRVTLRHVPTSRRRGASDACRRSHR